MSSQNLRKRRRMERRGSVVVLAAVFLVVAIACLAFSIDYGDLVVTESELQNAADAGAMSGAIALNYGREAAIEAAKKWSGKNLAAGKLVSVLDGDVEFGRWDTDTALFTIVPENSSEKPNAVRVTCHRTSARGTQLNLFFAPLIGTNSADLIASAIAVRPARKAGTRFIIDDEMIDKDVPAIENLASALGRDPEELVTPRGFNLGKQYDEIGWAWEDNFLDLPNGEILSLPTGQGTDYNNNDAGLFAIGYPDFPFQDNASLREFLQYSESGNDSTKWGSESNWVKSHLDPLLGVTPVTDSNSYPSLVNPDFIHVSPVNYSDINTLNMNGGPPQVNATGLRRGLLAFKIVGVGPDMDGIGSLLPELVIEIVDPTSIDPADLLAPGQNGTGRDKTKLVQ
jgi:Flp pilus assembly protein TadG